MEPVASEASHLLAFPSSLESVSWEMVLTEIEEFNTSLTSSLFSKALSWSSKSCHRRAPAPARDAWVKEEWVMGSLSQFGKHCDPSAFRSSNVKFCCSGMPFVCTLPHGNQ